MLTGWKTLIFNATNILGSHNAGYATLGIGLIGTVLRIFTSTPVGKAS